MGWAEWIPRIAGYGLAPFTGGASIPIGEAISQGLENKGAIDKANTQQQTATDTSVQQQKAGTDAAIGAVREGTNAALDTQRGAQKVNSDVYNQQRIDSANLFGGAFSTLGDLLGVKVNPIATGNQMSGQKDAAAVMRQPQRNAADVMRQPEGPPLRDALPGALPPIVPTLRSNAASAMQNGGTLAEMGAPQGAQPPPQAGLGVEETVKVKDPDGQVHDVPAKLLPIALQHGGIRVA